MRKLLLSLLFIVSGILTMAQVSKSYESLLQLTKQLRLLERTSLPGGVPDYRSQTIAKIQHSLIQIKNKHAKLDTSGWLLEHKVDYMLLLSEMNALDFNCRILKPWVRDPAFYAILWNEQSDTPDHEGPTSFAAIELWKYFFPLSSEQEGKLTAQLKVIPPLFEQAKINLTGNARDLWSAGTQEMKGQLAMLDELAAKTTGNSHDLKTAIIKAKEAAIKFIDWLEKKLPSKNGPSGIGKENYTWHLRNVMLVPFSWEDEVNLLNRELTRAYASLQLERERNKNIPELKGYKNEQEYKEGADAHIKKIMQFLKDKQVLPVKNYMEPALRKHTGSFVPEEKRNFFSNVSHHAPGVLFSHSTHWFEVARFTEEPHNSLLRKEPLPYNLWMQRNEGLATGMEEILMQAGLWDDNPRARELVWIMLAQRCARGLASLYVQDNKINFTQARKFQMDWTPQGWAGDESLAGFEQHLYLRQPGYGTCYVTGKYFIERIVMDLGRLEGEEFKLYNFFDKLYGVSTLPLSLVHWQLTGDDSQLKACFKK
jgi:hypothetical protein